MDYITPMVAVSTDLDMCDLHLDQDGPTSTLVGEEQMKICGREGDILALETKTAISNVLLIKASAGTGKTFLAQHLCWWWKTTGYVRDFIFMDCAMLAELEVHHVREKIFAALDISSTDGSNDVMTYLNEHKYLIIIDSLDAAQMNQQSSSVQKGLRSFLRKIKLSIVLLLSRFEEKWVQPVAKVDYYLNNLDMKASLQLASLEANRISCDVQTGDRLNLRFLEQCMSLVDGNALSISIMMRVYKASCDSFKVLYQKLTDETSLNGYGQDNHEEDYHRGFIDARHLVQLQTGPSGATLVCDDDLKLLAPFWRSFPANLACYRIFFQLAKARVTRHSEIANAPGFSLKGFWLKAAIAMCSAEDYKVAAKGKEFPAIKVSSLRSLEPSFQFCEEKGFLFRKSSVNANGNDKSVRIHPLLTLVLRSRPFALPEWAAHVVQVAFQRFISYQTRHWPMGTTLLGAPDKQRELDDTFANYATVCNFSLVIKPNVLNNTTLDIIHWSLYHIQRHAPAVLDICDRFLEVFGLPLAQNSPSTVPSMFFLAYRTVKKITKIGANYTTMDTRGMLETCCLGAIHYADLVAELLDVQHDNSELLEGIAKNLKHRSDCYDVNLTLLAMARTRLARHKFGNQDRTSAIKKIFKLTDDDFEWNSKYGLGTQIGAVDHDLAKRIAAAEAPEEICSLEQTLLGFLERQLDGIDAVERKTVIYENLAVLALKRERFEDAYQHIEMAIELFRPFHQNKPEAWNSLVDEREKILAMTKDNYLRSATAALDRVQAAGIIRSYNVTVADQEN